MLFSSASPFSGDIKTVLARSEVVAVDPDRLPGYLGDRVAELLAHVIGRLQAARRAAGPGRGVMPVP